MMRATFRILLTFALLGGLATAQEAAAPAAGPRAQSAAAPRSSSAADSFAVAEAHKAADDVLWHLELGDIADVDKVAIASSKPIRMSNATGQGAGNPFIMYAYTFVPKSLKGNDKAPLIVLVHGGVHASFDTSFAYP